MAKDTPGPRRLAESLVKKVRRRKIARRERVLSAAEKDSLLGTTAGEFRDFLTVLAETGIRLGQLPEDGQARLESSNRLGRPVLAVEGPAVVGAVNGEAEPERRAGGGCRRPSSA